MAGESALIIPVDEALAVVGSLRSLHDPVARLGVPPHFTVLYPFIPPPKVETQIEALTRLFATVNSFQFSLTEVRRFPASAYLHPDPTAPFVQLTEMIVQRWPQYPPYNGAFPTTIPHLTVADNVGADVLETVERTLASQLPIACRATQVWLLQSDDRGRWSPSHSFPLAANV